MNRAEADKVMGLIDAAWWQQVRDLPLPSRALYVQLFKALPFAETIYVIQKLVLTSIFLPKIAEITAALGFDGRDALSLDRLNDAIQAGTEYGYPIGALRWRDSDRIALPEAEDDEAIEPPVEPLALTAPRVDYRMHVAGRPYVAHGRPA